MFLRWIVASLRAFGIAIICFLLLSPLIESVDETEEKPIVVFAHDNSRSIAVGDSLAISQGYLSDYNKLTEEVAALYQTDRLVFGSLTRNNTPLDLTDAETDLSELFANLFDRYYNRNVGAIVVASDGIYNKGQDPLYLADRFPGARIFTIALGDTSLRKDALIEKVNANESAYLGNEFPIEVLVKANYLKGKSTQLRILHKGKVIHNVPVAYSNERYMNTFGFVIEASQTGLQHYVVELVEVSDEFTTVNNRMDVYVQVIASKQKVLLLAHAPHPDIAAIRHVLEGIGTYEVQVSLADGFQGVPDPYSLVILHQLPSKVHPISQFLSKLKQQNMPAALVIGAQTDFGALNSLNIGVSVQGYRGSFDVVTAQVNSTFNLFTMSNTVKEVMPEMPPLHVPFAMWKFSPAAEKLLAQKVGRVVKNEPLIAFTQVDQIRYGIISGEGLWRWRIHHPEAFAELTSKMFQYLTTKENKDPFRVFEDDEYIDNQSVVFEAEVYNETYELITEPRVSMTITDEAGKDFVYDFQVVGRHYRLDAGKLPAGSYRFKASTNVFGKSHQRTGEFSVKALQMELMNVVANHGLMFSLADKGNGKMFYPHQLEDLKNELLAQPIPGVVYQDTTYNPLLDWRWIAFILAAIFGLEWFLRKRFGAY